MGTEVVAAASPSVEVPMDEAEAVQGTRELAGFVHGRRLHRRVANDGWTPPG